MNRLMPLKSIRKYCICCCCDSTNEVKLCLVTDCVLYPVRDGKRHKNEVKLSPIKLIKVKCLDCSGFIKSEVKNCQETDCFLYLYRLGKNPNLKGKRNNKGNAMALKKWRETQKQSSDIPPELNSCKKTKQHTGFGNEKNTEVYLDMGNTPEI